MMTFAQTMFMAEAEGLLPTREGKINAVINEVKNYPMPIIDQIHFERILNCYGLNINDLSDKELRYINASIR